MIYSAACKSLGHDCAHVDPYRARLATGAIADFGSVVPLQPELFCLCDYRTKQVRCNKG